MPRRPSVVLLSYLQVAAGAVVLAYLGLMVFAWLFSDRMIFRPPPSTYADGPGWLRIPTPDGVSLVARYLPLPAAKYTLVYFHGNAEDLGQNEAHLAELRDRLGVAVFAWDYRGYGRSGGWPNTPATLRDAHTVLAYVTGALGVPRDRIILYGCSLGGGPAVAMAAEGPCAGLILQSVFTSAFRVMTRVRLLPFDKFDNLSLLPALRCPVLVIHGTADRVIPFALGRQVYAAVRGPKWHLWIEGAGHNNLIELAGDAYWDALRRFVAGL